MIWTHLIWFWTSSFWYHNISCNSTNTFDIIWLQTNKKSVPQAVYLLYNEAQQWVPALLFVRGHLETSILLHPFRVTVPTNLNFFLRLTYCFMGLKIKHLNFIRMNLFVPETLKPIDVFFFYPETLWFHVFSPSPTGPNQRPSRLTWTDAPTAGPLWEMRWLGLHGATDGSRGFWIILNVAFLSNFNIPKIRIYFWCLWKKVVFFSKSGII